jgi:tetratricopeptide (TPR) repeat protein
MQYNHAVEPANAPYRRSVMLLMLVALVTYSNVLHGDFQFDDVPTILDNPHYADWETFANHVGHIIRPLLSLTFVIDHQLYGLSPVGYHVLNLFLHLGSGLLIYRILAHAVPADLSAVAVWTAMLFLVHPLATEAVTYISGRASSLAAFWYLAGFSFYIRPSADISEKSATRLTDAAGLVCFVFALASKETATTFPLALLLWDILIRRLRGPRLRSELLWRHLPFWLVLGYAAVMALTHARYSTLMHFSVGIRPLWEHLLSELHAAMVATVLYVTPWNQTIDHDLPVIRSILEWPAWLELSGFFSVIAATIWLSRREPWAAFGMAWFILQLLPTTLIPRNDLLSERNVYLASFGLLLAGTVLTLRAARALIAAFPQGQYLVIGCRTLGASVVVMLCLLTYHRNALYQDAVLLWSDAVDKAPRKARPHNNLGHALATRGEWEAAIDEFRLAVTLDPGYTLAQDNLRHAYLHQVGRR